MIENNPRQRRRRLTVSNKNESLVPGANQVSIQIKRTFPEGLISFTEELKEVLRRRGKIDP